MTKRKRIKDSTEKFKGMPKPMQTTRKFHSTVKNQTNQLYGPFAGAIMPGVVSKEDLKARWLLFYDTKVGMVPCVWCGNQPASAWDHLNSIRRNNEWDGYWNTADNLVPSCNRCNNSRRNQNWIEWLKKIDPKRIPKVRSKLEKAEINVFSLTPKQLQDVREWKEYREYYRLYDSIVEKLKKAQHLADQLRERIGKIKPRRKY